MNDGTNDGIFNLAVVQVHVDFIADLEDALRFLGWHARNLRRRQGYFQGCELTMTPASFASVTQCLGWGVKAPRRMFVAYGWDTSSAKRIALTVSLERPGRILLL